MKKEKQQIQFINHGTDEQMEISGFTRSVLGLTITWIFIVLSVGFLRLVFYWKPNWLILCTHKRCFIKYATKVLLKDKYQQWFVENVEILNISDDDVNSLSNSIDGDIDSLGQSGRNQDVIMYRNQTSQQKDQTLNKSVNEDIITERETFLNRTKSKTEKQHIKYFINKRWKYIWNDETNNFEKLKGLEEDVSTSFFHRCYGLTEEEQTQKRLIHGENSIRIHLTPIFRLFFKEVLSPFYIFQVFSCALWYYDDYIYYASCIVLLSAISIIYTLYSIRQNERALRDIIHHGGTVTVFRKHPMGRHRYTEEEIPSENLVPGDLIAIKNMSIMQCDAVLLNGNVIVNESMLTGESVPVTKTALSCSRGTSVSICNDQFRTGQTAQTLKSNQLQDVKLDIKEHSRHIIFSGTQVIQTRYYENEKIKAVVLRTGFNTTKGELVRAILHPKPVDFHFNRDTYKYVAGLSAIAFVGMIFSMVIKIMKKNPAADVIKRSLDIITIAVPPALPGALAAGLIYSQNRLRKQKIYCISPRTINICGTINTFVFDKTGTLTEDGLDLKCVLPVGRHKHALVEEIDKYTDYLESNKEKNNNNSVYFDEEIRDVSEFPLKSQLLEAMATCHSINRIHGDLAGDPLDCKMFEFTKWEFNEPNSEETEIFDKLSPPTVRPKLSRNKNDLENSQEIGIMRQFPFSSSLQRMSVIVRALNTDHFTLFCKGSPEKIAEMAKPETLPNDFQSVLTKFTREGYRVIAVATKRLDLTLVKAQRIEREKLENNLEFLGLIIMENRLKPETTSVINRLVAANVRTIMCTGDNILTALSVARDCDMINEEDRVIIIEANPGEDPKFTYAEILKHKVKEIEFDPKSKMCIQKDKGSHFHFAVSGKSFAVIRNEHKDLLNKLAVRGTVFGRMSPEQKQQLIETLQDLGYFVGMCGDGANDCGALKAANAGISLSNAEASVASPFTSKNANIECVPMIIREGRSALVTSFGIVKFICMYSLTQFISVIILYTINAGITDFEFLYIDLVLATILAFFFSRTEPYPELYKKPPLNKLMAWRPVCSLLGHMVIILAIQLFTFYYVKSQPWFEAYEDSDNKIEKNFACYENTAVFTVSMFQYITEAIIFSKGAPYRRSIFSNYLFMAILIAVIIGSLFIALVPLYSVLEFFGLRLIPDIRFRLILVCIAVIHFFLAFIFESYIIDPDFLMNHDIKDEHVKHAKDDLQKKCYPKRTNNQMPYQKIEFELRKDAHWPPISNNATTTTQTNVVLNEKNTNEIVSANLVSSSRSNSNNHLNRSDSKKLKKHTKLDDTNFEMKTTANDKLIYELDSDDIPIKISPNLNDQYTKI